MEPKKTALVMRPHAWHGQLLSCYLSSGLDWNLELHVVVVVAIDGIFFPLQHLDVAIAMTKAIDN